MEITTNREAAMTVKTLTQFKRNAERVLRNAHADASIAITWNHANKCKFFDGSTGYSGTITVAAPGYRTRGMVASFSHGEMSVR